MNCCFCARSVGEYDWGYMIDDEEGLIYAHLDCIAWDETIERVETMDYLAANLTF